VGPGVTMGTGTAVVACGLAAANTAVMASAALQLISHRPLNAPQVMLLTVGLVAVPPLLTAAALQRRAALCAKLCQRRLHKHRELIYRHSQDLFWEVDAAGVVTGISRSSARTLGAGPELLTGRDLLSLVHPDDAERTGRLFRACVRRQTGWDHIRVRALRVDGTAVVLDCSGVMVPSSSGQPGFVATAHVVDEDRAAQHDRDVKLHRIQAVLAQRTLTTVLQPIFSLQTGRVVGVEALSRFPDRPRQGPDRWFADAHEVGLGVALEALAVQTALAHAVTLSSDSYVAVNVSPATLISPALQQVLAAGPVPASRIVLELTEHVFVDNYDQLTRALSKLRARGLRLAVDDAGAGFASFRHILRLQPDVIKIDQEITREITTQPAHRALTAALVMFALEVGSTTVIAEGVETADELRTIASLGIDAAQGYFLARPTATETAWNPIADLSSFDTAVTAPA
jgi:PAS domain S-box-containing protein